MRRIIQLARESLEAIPDSASRLVSTADLVAALLRAGAVPEAAAMVPSMPASGERAESIPRVAAFAAASGAHDIARKMVDLAPLVLRDLPSRGPWRMRNVRPAFQAWFSATRRHLDASADRSYSPLPHESNAQRVWPGRGSIVEAHLVGGALDAAIDGLESLPDGADKRALGIAVGSAFLQAEMAEGATRVLNCLRQDSGWSGVLDALVEKALTLEQYEFVVEAAAVEDSKTSGDERVLRSLRHLLSVDQREAAKRLLKQWTPKYPSESAIARLFFGKKRRKAKALIRSVALNRYSAERVGIAWAILGDSKPALAALKKAGSREDRLSGLTRIALDHGVTGGWVQAAVEHLRQKAKTPIERMRAALILTRIAAANGKLALIERRLGAAEALIEDIPDSSGGRDDALLLLLETQRDLALNRALSTLERIRVDRRPTRLVGSVAAALHRADEPDAAVAALRTLPDVDRAWGCCYAIRWTRDETIELPKEQAIG